MPPYNTKMWSAGDRSMKWLIPGPIPVGGSVTPDLQRQRCFLGPARQQLAGNQHGRLGLLGHPGRRATNPWTYRHYDSNQDTVVVNFEFPS